MGNQMQPEQRNDEWRREVRDISITDPPLGNVLAKTLDIMTTEKRMELQHRYAMASLKRERELAMELDENNGMVSAQDTRHELIRHDDETTSSGSTIPLPNDLVERSHGSSCTESEIGDVKLTLMEQLHLLGLKDKQGYTSFWNEKISPGLRGCVLIELALRGRIALESPGVMKEGIMHRKVEAVSGDPTGDSILDEALAHIKEKQPKETVTSWIAYFLGETWYPSMLCYQLKNGVLTTARESFFFYDRITHPLLHHDAKARLVRDVQDSAVKRKTLEEPMLALLFIANYADIFEGLIHSDKDYETATRDIKDMMSRERNTDNVSRASEIMQAVFAYLG